MIVVMCLLIAAVLGKTLQSELAPIEDKSQVRLQMTGPEGASYPYMMKETEDLQNYVIDSIPEAGFHLFLSTRLSGHRSKFCDGKDWTCSES